MSVYYDHYHGKPHHLLWLFCQFFVFNTVPFLTENEKATSITNNILIRVANVYWSYNFNIVTEIQTQILQRVTVHQLHLPYRSLSSLVITEYSPSVAVHICSWWPVHQWEENTVAADVVWLVVDSLHRSDSRY